MVEKHLRNFDNPENRISRVVQSQQGQCRELVVDLYSIKIFNPTFHPTNSELTTKQNYRPTLPDFRQLLQVNRYDSTQNFSINIPLGDQP